MNGVIPWTLQVLCESSESCKYTYSSRNLKRLTCPPPPLPPPDVSSRKLHATYEGAYVDGKKAGTGKMTYPNGDVYTGQWKDNAMEGEGTYVYAVRPG